MKHAFVLLLIVAAAAVSSGGTAHAQSPFGGPSPFAEPPVSRFTERMTLQVDVLLSDTRDNDLVGINGYDEGDNPERYYDTLARAASDAVGVPRGSSRVAVDPLDESDSPTYQSAIEVDGHIGTRLGDDRRIEFDAAALQRIARTWGFGSVDLEICPSGVTNFQDNSTPVKGREESGDSCLNWNVPAVSAPGEAPTRISVIEQPDLPAYRGLVGILAAVCVGLSVLALVASVLMRRFVFPSLNAGTLAMIGLSLVLAMLAWLITAIVFATYSSPFTDYALARNLGDGGKFVAVTVPALLPALPLMVVAVFLTRARPPGPQEVTKKAAANRHGVPSWIDVGDSSPKPQSSTPPAPAAPARNADPEPSPPASTGNDDETPPPSSGWSPPS